MNGLLAKRMKTAVEQEQREVLRSPCSESRVVIGRLRPRSLCAPA